MQDSSWNVDGCEVVVELIVVVPEGRLMKVVERRVSQRIECRFDCVVGITKAQAWIWVWVRGWLWVGPEQVL